MQTALIILSITMPIICISAFFIGYKAGKSAAISEYNKPQNTEWLAEWYARQKAKLPSKSVEETEEQRKQRILDENIERYDGSPKGQQKI